MKNVRAKEIPHVKPVPPVSKEEQAARVAQFLTQKREQYFQGILYNLLQNPNITTVSKVTVSGDLAEHRFFNINEVVDQALAGADYAMKVLFPITKQEGK